MVFTRLLRDVVEFCYPPLCAHCRASSPDGAPLCPACDAQLDRLAQVPACELCGLSLAYPNAPCAHCNNRGVPHYDRVVRLGSFDPPLRGLIHHLKYHHAWTAGEFLADRLLSTELAKALLTEADRLLPVPLHRFRQFTRGYNQSEVIARRLGQTCDIPIAEGVCRRRHTETQTHLHSRAQRMRNLRDAFRLTDDFDVRGLHVVVIDDVLTTGATLQTLARTLRPARPASLSVLVVAVADPKRHSAR